ncbi:hypothetical protein OTK51_19760 [Vibrio scophthalmi]|uniref:hypothetical protein n=1 Tax=Vibrio scophthalmi TaxID=45658 RepID=UPI002285365A|nr:hypothetical protein [Vibrio scophthalmi]MCY9805667.1 hypothetical protein [Vibrio scophthalmi]
MKILVIGVLEYVSVFLLAVEAIKLENLSWVKDKTIKFRSILNPKITFVDAKDYVAPTTFLGKHGVKLFTVALYIVGVGVSAWGLSLFGLQMSGLLPDSALSWSLSGLYVLFICPIIGFAVYNSIVVLFSIVIKALSWVERSTKSGAVGILGFALFSIQFFMK